MVNFKAEHRNGTVVMLDADGKQIAAAKSTAGNKGLVARLDDTLSRMGYKAETNWCYRSGGTQYCYANAV